MSGSSGLRSRGPSTARNSSLRRDVPCQPRALRVLAPSCPSHAVILLIPVTTDHGSGPSCAAPRATARRRPRAGDILGRSAPVTTRLLFGSPASHRATASAGTTAPSPPLASCTPPQPPPVREGASSRSTPPRVVRTTPPRRASYSQAPSATRPPRRALAHQPPPRGPRRPRKRRPRQPPPPPKNNKQPPTKKKQPPPPPTTIKTPTPPQTKQKPNSPPAGQPLAASGRGGASSIRGRRAWALDLPTQVLRLGLAGVQLPQHSKRLAQAATQPCRDNARRVVWQPPPQSLRSL